MLPIDGDPELTKMAMEANAELEKEIDSMETDAIVDEAFDKGLDLMEDFTRIEAAETMTEIEDFKADELEIKVSETLSDFRAALDFAKLNGIESIQASKKVIWHFTKPNYPKDFFYNHDGIRVEEVGKQDEVQKFLHKTIEEVNFGKR